MCAYRLEVSHLADHRVQIARRQNPSTVGGVAGESEEAEVVADHLPELLVRRGTGIFGRQIDYKINDGLNFQKKICSNMGGRTKASNWQLRLTVVLPEEVAEIVELEVHAGVLEVDEGDGAGRRVVDDVGAEQVVVRERYRASEGVNRGT